jgi:hypothetical protein
VPALPDDVHDLDGLRTVGRALGGEALGGGTTAGAP